jgi:CubicO group peptidase (beta-lactamase class C family)
MTDLSMRSRTSPSAPRSSLALAVLLLATSALPLAGCGDSSSSSHASGLRWPGPEWAVSEPAAEGMTPAALEEARQYAFAPERNTQGVVVVRNGAIVAEWYADGRDAASLATSWSAGKSFAGTLIGIAIDRGDIAGLDVSLGDFFPSWQGDGRGAVTLRDLLEMRSGLRWNELADDPVFHAATDDQLAAALSRPLDHPPGTRWNYASADSMLISGVIERATGRSAGAFAQEVLFGPIGMTADWWTDAAGHTLTYCCVDTTTRDFARFGLLFARAGEWDGRRIVSREWVDEASRPLADVPFYALHWWTNVSGLEVNGAEVRLFTARGLHDQNVYVFPELDLVVVRNGLYTKVGDGSTVRTGGNYLSTQQPASWDDVPFLTPILRSIDAAADTSALAGAAAAAAAVQADPAGALRAP